ncbi:hypothetical protein FOS14_17755 [Skermania sp. ID1734]|uniref:hypothetical protein n=1 Tax=Skermania sp. ID1734 TaxID=2597516 RepID=UPI0011811FBE|nr:hypothetical protein [Skermania sp. ID1734]TSD95646.1 hypothetical protein FOS14_17755 [Skermania sp. ID1734]
MKRLVAAGLVFVVGVEIYALFLPSRRIVAWAAGLAVAIVLIAVRWFLDNDESAAADEPPISDPQEALRRWLSRTETLIGWSEATRADWDRHLRPMLAREFQLATGHRQNKDPAALDATGRMLFGPELWSWVDPSNVSRARAAEPGPGRSALDEILRRLEQV